MILESVCVGSLEVNCYIIAVDKASPAIIIDPGDEEDKIRCILAKYVLKPAFIINTHGHYDHIGCDDRFNIPVYIHRLDKPLLEDPQKNLSAAFEISYNVRSPIKVMEDKDNITLGKINLEVIHIPGHTPGGVCLLMKSPKDNILFSGDVLFCRGIGRSDLAGGNEASLIKGIKEKLLVLPDKTIVYPGHGPSTTIGEEKRENPFLQ